MSNSDRTYFVNPWIDFALIGGLSCLTFVGLRLFHSGERSNAIYQIAALLLWIGNWPHFAATNSRLYGSMNTIRQYPATSFLVPAVILLAMIGSFQSPEFVAPYFVKLFLIWSPYHFSGQTFGIAMLYARRSGYSLDSKERLALTSFINLTFIYALVRAEVGQTPQAYYSVFPPALGLPSVALEVVGLLLGLSTIGLLVSLATSAKRNGRWAPSILLLPLLTQFLWFVPGGQLPAFNEFVPFFHSVQYLLIAWAMQLSASNQNVRSESFRWGIRIVVLGAVLFFLFPRVCTLMGFKLPVATAIVIAGVQIHHFFVDGVIWKLKNPKVSSPLMVHLPDLWKPAHS